MDIIQKNVSEGVAGYEEAFTEIKENDEEGNPARVFMFFSVDLVNSTKYKAENSEWAAVIGDFYKIIEMKVTDVFKEFKIWKYVGDEILFYLEVREIPDILNAPSVLHSAMRLAKEEFYEEHPKAKCFLYFKGALWLAAAKRNSIPEDELIENIFIEDLSTGVDFIGVDIDGGFRMSKNASQGKIVVDPKIAFILNKHKRKWRDLTDRPIVNRVKIVGYAFLKGIWNGRAFPIIWYTDDWEDKDLFLYDEQYDNEFAKNYISKSEDVQPIKHIQKIFSDLGFVKHITMIEDIISSNKGNQPYTYKEKISRIEMQCATVCIDVNENKAFVLKRTGFRENLPDLWEFGCSTPFHDENYVNGIKRGYKDQFELDIDLKADNYGKPIPLRVYEIEDREEMIIKKGVVLVAEIVGSVDNIKLDEKKYSEYKFIAPDELDTLDKNDCVEGFHDSIRLAFDKLKLDSLSSHIASQF